MLIKRFFFTKLVTITLLMLSFAEAQSKPGNLSLTDTATIQQDTLSTDSSSVKKSNQEVKDTVKYESDRIDYDAENKVLHLVGRAVVTYQNLKLTADTIVYHINDNLFTASGFPQLLQGSDTTVGDFMAYNIKTRRGRVKYATTHVDDAFFSGNQIVLAKGNQIYVNKGDYTTCAIVDTPDYFFYGRDIKIVPNDKIVGRPVVLNIGDAPVAVLPYFIFPTERRRRSGILTPSWGGHPTSGGYVDNVGYYYVPNDFVDFTLSSRIQEFSQFVVNASSRYALRYLLNGSISGRYAVNTNYFDQRSQWAIDYGHSQYLTPDGLTRLAGNGSLISEKGFYRKYSENNNELREQNLTANLSLSRTFEKINGSGSLSWNRTHNLYDDRITENIPSIDFNLPSRPLIPSLSNSIGDNSSDLNEPKWYNQIYWDYSGRGIVHHDVYKRDSTSPKSEYYRPGVTSQVSLNAPQKIFKYFTITPRFEAHGSGFRGYIDTLVKDTSFIFDTVRYRTSDFTSDKRYTDYTLLKVDTISRDSLGFTIVYDTVTKISPARKYPIRDTVNNTFSTMGSWSTGVSLHTNVYGLFPINLLGLQGIRHTITPSISYTYVPEFNSGRTFFNIGIPYDRPSKAKQLLGISISNQLQGKYQKPAAVKGEKPQETKFQILSAGLSTTYDAMADSFKLSNLQLNASTSYSFLGISLSSSSWFYDQNKQLSLPILQNYNISVSTGSLGAKGTLWGGDLIVFDSLQPDNPVKYYNAGAQSWQFSFTPAYSYSQSRRSPTDVFVPNKNYNLSASANINFTRNWAFRWSGNYNFIVDQMVQNSFSANYDGECWEMRFEWRPERLNPGYYFLINIKKIPEIKWEQRN